MTLPQSIARNHGSYGSNLNAHLLKANIRLNQQIYMVIIQIIISLFDARLTYNMVRIHVSLRIVVIYEVASRSTSHILN